MGSFLKHLQEACQRHPDSLLTDGCPLSHTQLLHQHSPKSPFIPEQWPTKYRKGLIFKTVQVNWQRASNSCHQKGFIKHMPGPLHDIWIIVRQCNSSGNKRKGCLVRASERATRLYAVLSYACSHRSSWWVVLWDRFNDFHFTDEKKKRSLKKLRIVSNSHSFWEYSPKGTTYFISRDKTSVPQEVNMGWTQKLKKRQNLLACSCSHTPESTEAGCLSLQHAVPPRGYRL